jgi:hypothetical protein
MTALCVACSHFCSTRRVSFFKPVIGGIVSRVPFRHSAPYCLSGAPQSSSMSRRLVFVVSASGLSGWMAQSRCGTRRRHRLLLEAEFSLGRVTGKRCHHHVSRGALSDFRTSVPSRFNIAGLASSAAHAADQLASACGPQARVHCANAALPMQVKTELFKHTRITQRPHCTACFRCQKCEYL